MRDWLVAWAVIEGPDGLLLVRNRRGDGRVDWSPPGGVVDPGETVVEGLTREVAEETGLVVREWSPLLYEIEAEAPDMGWRLRVEAYRAVAWEGVLTVDDPDGIVDDVRWVPAPRCAHHLEGGPPWVADPLHEWLAAPWPGRRSYGYRVLGRTGALEVTRL
jgi:8-oxo-dGTP diphosphatase